MQKFVEEAAISRSFGCINVKMKFRTNFFNYFFERFFLFNIKFRIIFLKIFFEWFFLYIWCIFRFTAHILHLTILFPGKSKDSIQVPEGKFVVSPVNSSNCEVVFLPKGEYQLYVSRCSAFMIGDGKLLTNAHCVEHETQVTYCVP